MSQIEQIQASTKWDRINSIYELMDKSVDGLTIEQMSTISNVSRRTIQRDLNDVLIGYGAVRIGQKWKLDKMSVSDNLQPNEKIILGILDEMAKGGGKAFYGKAHSLLAKMTQHLEQPIFTNVDSETLDDSNIELFISLENSIKNKQEVTFSYKTRQYKVKPLKLAFFEGFWYLLVFDSNENDKFKKFHLKSIINITQTDDTFCVTRDIEQRLNKANSIWFDLDKDPFDIHLFIEKDVAVYFKRKPLKSQMIIGEDSDGSMEIIVSISNEKEILPIIFWYLPHVKVLSPEWIADIVKEKVTKYHDDL